MNFIHDFISLIYPNICASCGNSLWKHEKIICTFCDLHLPRTDFHLDQDNPVSRIFWGRVMIESAASLYYFNKGNRVQHLVHQLKYKGRKDIGICLGEKYGQMLRNSPLFDTVNLIVPVPLFKKKLMQRGYNQSEQFAEGLSRTMHIPYDGRVLLRTRATETQTRKSRFRRWQNVDGLFAVTDPAKLSGHHILLVDDVITTGATIEACIQEMIKVPDTLISVASIAVTLL
jgi:ComF family protein